MNFYLVGKCDGARKVRWAALFWRTLLTVFGAVAVFFAVLYGFSQGPAPLPLGDAFKWGLLLLFAALIFFVVLPLTMPLFLGVERLPELAAPGTGKQIPFAWLFGWPMVRRYLFVVTALATVIALLYAEENWRGKRAWNKYYKEMAARGVKLDRAAFGPPAVPDSENFAKSPFFAPLFDMKPGTQEWRDQPAYEKVGQVCEAHHKASGRRMPPVRFVNSWVREATDLQAWHAAFYLPPNTNNVSEPLSGEAAMFARRYGHWPGEENPEILVQTNLPVAVAAAGILEALEPCSPVLEEIRASSRRPHSRFDIAYDWEPSMAMLLPHLSVLRRIASILQLRASAELALGKTEDAFEDVLLMFRISEATRDEPFIISYLVRIALLQTALQPVHEGIMQAKWSDSHLSSFQQALARVDILRNADRAMQGDRVLLANGMIDYFRRHRGEIDTLGGTGSPTQEGDPSTFVFRFCPGGWFNFERVNFCRLFDSYFSAIDLGQRRLNKEAVRAADKRVKALLQQPWLGLVYSHYAFSSIFLPASSGVQLRTCNGQTALDVAQIACALERYKLMRGNYPETLEALVPQFISKLPVDVISGKPLKYRVAENHRPVIYSVGWNETDDGGTAGFKKGELHPDFEQGDWVWQ